MDRNELFEMCIAAGFTSEHVNEYERAFEALVKLTAERERERCNKLCKKEYEWAEDELRQNNKNSSHWSGRMRAAQDIGNLIRSGSNE